jgi:polyisoprenoid-binding protein YceI
MRAVTAAVLAVGLAAPARAAEQILRLDPAATRVEFTLDATLHSAKGRLPLREGEIDIDLAAGTAHGRLVFDAARAETGHEGRDEKMHAEVLESARYPEIVYTVTGAKADLDATGAGTVTLEGAVAIHGSQHPCTVTGRVRREGDRVVAEGNLTIPYVAWGMKDPSVFVLRVAKEVAVRFTAVGMLAPARAPDAAP